MLGKPVVCFDFDGVLHSYISGWKGVAVIPDKPVPGAVEAVNAYIAAGFEVYVFSSRSCTLLGREAMYKWCEKNGFPVENMFFTKGKPSAILTIDDRAFCFQGMFPSVNFIKNFKPWNKE